MPDSNPRRNIVALLGELAVVLPEAQAQLDRIWQDDLRRSLAPVARAGEVDKEALHAATVTLLSGRMTLARQTAELSCHVSNARETGKLLGANLRFTPVSVDISLRRREVLDHACRISVAVEQIPIPSDQPQEGEHRGTGT